MSCRRAAKRREARPTCPYVNVRLLNPSSCTRKSPSAAARSWKKSIRVLRATCELLIETLATHVEGTSRLALLGHLPHKEASLCRNYGVRPTQAADSGTTFDVREIIEAGT